METIQCNCPTCGGKLVFDNQSKTMYCPNCDKHFLIDEQPKIKLEENNNIDDEKVRIDDEKVKVDSEQTIAKPKKSKKVWKIILGILFEASSTFVGNRSQHVSTNDGLFLYSHGK